MTTTTISTRSAGLSFGSGNTIDVINGGSTVGFTLLSATENVSAGGIASTTTVETDAFLRVSAGGLSVSARISSGGQDVVAGSARFTEVSSSGFEYVIPGGVTVSTAVGFGGEETVSSGAAASATTVAASGALMVSGGVAVDAIVSGAVYVSSGAVLSGGTVLAHAQMIVFAGAHYSDVKLSAGALLTQDKLQISGSGVTITVSGISATVSGASYAGSGAIPLAAREISGTFLYGAVLSIGSGGGGAHDQFGSGGLECVAAGGSADFDSIGNRGTEWVGASGTASGFTIQNGGTLVVAVGGVVSNGTLSAGAQFVAFGATLGAGRSLTVAPRRAIDTHLNVGAFGLTSDVTIASDTTLAGGTLIVASGGVLAGTLGFAGSGSELVLDSIATPGAALSGFGSGDVIDYSGLAYDSGSASASFAGDTITVHDGGTVLSLTVTADASYASGSLLVESDGSGGTELLACFCPGTRIATPSGEVAVEDLCVGDLVMTEHRPLPVRFLGVQTVARKSADPLSAWPVRICAGALGAGLPARDLRLSPGHALFIDGLLVQAGALVDGVTAVRETVTDDAFQYFHVELDRHALLLAEGVPAESFLDLAEPVRFDNAATRPALPPAAALPYPRAKSARQLPPRLRARAAA